MEEPEDKSLGESDLPRKDEMGHRERVRAAFESWQREHAEHLSQEDEFHMLGIREAIEEQDVDRAQEHISKIKGQSSWLFEELMKHPEISAIIRELSILGF